MKILVTGLKGGAGRTTVAKNLQYILGKEDNTITLIDSKAVLDCTLRQNIKEADYLLVVEEAGILGYKDLESLLPYLQMGKKPIGLLINRSNLSDNLELKELMDKAEIPLLMEIPFNKYLARILKEGKLLVEEMKEMEKAFMDMLVSIKDSVKEEA